MKNLVLGLLSGFIALTASAQQPSSSKRPSSIPGVRIENAHALAVDTQNRPTVVRGRAPEKNRRENQYQDLRRLGITDVLIFKNDTKGEVAAEITELRAMGVRPHHIPFPWKDLPDFRTTCEMTLAALKTIRDVEVGGGRIFFHCTVGQDRTGYLAGLYRLAKSRSFGRANFNREAYTINDVFQREMCARGYEAGAGPGKPFETVVLPIRQGLTPAYLTFAKMIQAYGLVDDLCLRPTPPAATREEFEGLICSAP